jgi:hypothetical protein
MKEIKDYLHLYLGCEMLTVDGRIVTLNLTNLGFALKGIIGSELSKPILRPLSDMTEEEKIELKLNMVQATTLNHAPEIMWTFEQMRILLSKCFDLFGLIEAGLAIDKTAIK